MAVIDADLRPITGTEAAARIRRELPHVGVVILAADDKEETLFEAIGGGAAAYLNKDWGPAELVDAIRRVRAGEFIINEKVFTRPAVASKVLAEFRELSVYGSGAAKIFSPLSPPRGADPRQHRPGPHEQGGRLRARDLGADREEPHVEHPAEALGERPDPGRRLRDAAGLDQGAGGLVAGPVTSGALLAELGAEQGRLAAEIREIDALIESTRGEVARLQAREDQATAGVAAVRDRAGATADEALAVSDELVAVLRRHGAMVAELDALQAKRKLLDRLDAQLAGALRHLGQLAETAAPVESPPIDETRLLRAVVATQEEERRRIARAVHDGPAQAMANVVLQAEIAERVFAMDADRARQKLAALRAMVNRTLQELRGFIFELRPMILDDLGLVPTLRRYIQTIVDKHGVKVDFERPDETGACRATTRSRSSGSSGRARRAGARRPRLKTSRSRWTGATTRSRSGCRATASDRRLRRPRLGLARRRVRLRARGHAGDAPQPGPC